MRNLKIGTRLFILIFIQLVILVILSLNGYISLNVANTSLETLNQTVEDQAALNRLSNTIRADLLDTVNRMNLGTITWEDAAENLRQANSTFESGWQSYLDNFTPTQQETIQEEYQAGLTGVREVFTELESLFDERDRTRLALFLANDLNDLTEPFFTQLSTDVEQAQTESLQTFEQAQSTSGNFLIIMLILAVAGIGFAALVGSMIYNSISDPLQRLTDTVEGLAGGDFNIRSDLEGNDELAELGQAFDQLLQQRLVTLVQAERENEILNDSIIALLQAVSQLSQRDLTVRVPVTEDVTGPVADALNLLTSETASVLADVTHISEEVATASDKVKNQSDMVIDVATAEREEVERTATELAEASAEMNRIAELAQACDTAADNAIQTTRAALETVNNTVAGINNTRDTIRETEKRIKRLGERSQEISSVVNIINTIAERTHILALNASMHAASAGEAGRGFAVVADEVQRLAQNSREATSQIATLVSNIQTETADTVTAMNQAISQVVDGSRLAEQAGEQMRKTQETTADLVAVVQQIASRSQEQAKTSTGLLERARQIQESTRQTSQQLQEQTVQTNNLVGYARNLLSSVRLFKLPAEEAS
ncbi:MAG: methyl-accepting chemotaxis protein [Candidatus Competibacteraceae bacterium]|jgi:methyl-accepting chemotaxis protein|nr:methyl-accepting chemotaxis protein [Candidatus Competibacteraceae bacterium]